MYKEERVEFGTFEKLVFWDEKKKNGFSVVPAFGGTILEIWLDGQQILDACETPAALENNAAYKSSLLFPFPNRLEDGTYERNGKHYQFPINDAGTNNALHGLSRDLPMDILSSESSATGASVTLSYFDEGHHAAYPFPFLFEVRYSIDTEKGFEVAMKFSNEANENIPVGIGWHPYFKMGNQVDDLTLQLPACKMIEIDERMIPTGTLLDYDYFEKPRLIQKAVLDNGFKLSGATDKAEVVLSDGQRSLVYWQGMGPEQFNFLQVYTPPHRQSIAIEPMTCNIDAFNNGDGLVILKPEAFIEASCGIRML